MGYRNLTNEQFSVVRDVATKVCEQEGLKTIGEFKKMGNAIIDKLESGEITYADLLQPTIDFLIV